MFCITAPGFGRALAYQLLPLEKEEPEGEQIVSFQKKKNQKKEIRGGKEVGRQRRKHLIGHLSVGLDRGWWKNNGKPLQSEQCHAEYVPV